MLHELLWLSECNQGSQVFSHHWVLQAREDCMRAALQINGVDLGRNLHGVLMRCRSLFQLAGSENEGEGREGGSLDLSFP